MKNLFTIALILFSIHTMNAQQSDCIICPEMLGLATNVEHGVNISTLTPSAKTIIASSEEQKNAKADKSNKSKANKKADRNKNTRNKKASNSTIAIEETEDDGIMGFADANTTQQENYYQVETSDDYGSGEDCGCGEVNETGETNVETEETFTLYPNPAHHWVVINAEHLEEGDYKIFLKDTQGNVIKERTLTDSTTKLDLQRMKKGVYFVTLRNENDHSTFIQKVTVQ